MNCLQATIVCALLVCSSTAWAGTPDDYASGISVTPHSGSALQRLSIPDVVYQETTSPALADVALFNQGGDPVPFALRRPTDSTRWSPWHSLPAFPIATVQNGSASKIEVALKANGAIVSVDGISTTSDSAVTIVDASAYDAAIDELEIVWSPQRPSEIVHLQLETSDTLDHWRFARGDTAVVSLEAAGHHVEQNRIALGGITAAYLRITARTGVADFRIDSVRVRRSIAAAPVMVERTLTAPVVVTDHGAYPGIEFDTGGLFPVAHVHLTWPTEPIHALEVDVFSRASVDHPWRNHGRHRFYRTRAVADEVGDQQVGPALAVNHVAHRFWRFQPSRTAFARPQALALRIGWLPHEAVFVAQGIGGFTLAFGAAVPSVDQWTVADLRLMLPEGESFDDVPYANLGDHRTLGGPQRTQVTKPIPWETIVLWSVLVLGVIMVGTFAWTLARAS